MKNKLPTIDIKGKEYTLVKDRVIDEVIDGLQQEKDKIWEE